MAIDPVCGMEVDPLTTEYITEYQDEIFYFCSPGCKISFDADPEAYMGIPDENEDLD